MLRGLLDFYFECRTFTCNGSIFTLLYWYFYFSIISEYFFHHCSAESADLKQESWDRQRVVGSAGRNHMKQTELNLQSSDWSCRGSHGSKLPPDQLCLPAAPHSSREGEEEEEEGGGGGGGGGGGRRRLIKNESDVWRNQQSRLISADTLSHAAEQTQQRSEVTSLCVRQEVTGITSAAADCSGTDTLMLHWICFSLKHAASFCFISFIFRFTIRWPREVIWGGNTEHFYSTSSFGVIFIIN